MKIWLKTRENQIIDLNSMISFSIEHEVDFDKSSSSHIIAKDNLENSFILIRDHDKDIVQKYFDKIFAYIMSAVMQNTSNVEKTTFATKFYEEQTADTLDKSFLAFTPYKGD